MGGTGGTVAVDAAACARCTMGFWNGLEMGYTHWITWVSKIGVGASMMVAVSVRRWIIVGRC